MSGFPLDSSAIFKHYERKSLIIPDRQAATVETWLKNHPGVQLISRDRAGEFARGARLFSRQMPHVASTGCRCDPLGHFSHGSQPNTTQWASSRIASACKASAYGNTISFLDSDFLCKFSGKRCTSLMMLPSSSRPGLAFSLFCKAGVMLSLRRLYLLTQLTAPAYQVMRACCHSFGQKLG